MIIMYKLKFFLKNTKTIKNQHKNKTMKKKQQIIYTLYSFTFRSGIRYVGSWTHQKATSTGALSLECDWFLLPLLTICQPIEPHGADVSSTSSLDGSQLNSRFGPDEFPRWTRLQPFGLPVNIFRRLWIPHSTDCATRQSAASSISQPEDRWELTVTVCDQGRQLTTSMSGLTVQVNSMPQVVVTCKMWFNYHRDTTCQHYPYNCYHPTLVVPQTSPLDLPVCLVCQDKYQWSELGRSSFIYSNRVAGV